MVADPQPPVEKIDAHAHVFASGLRLAEARRYAPTYDAMLQDYLHLLDGNGVTHGVLVQPSFLGTDNSFLLAALRAQPHRLRGVAVVSRDIDEAGLASLEAAGIRGIRLNLVGVEIPDLGSSEWRSHFLRVARLGLHVEVHCDAVDLQRVAGPILESGARLVVDHFGRFDPGLGVGDPGFAYLLSLGAGRRTWVKLSAVYRNGVAYDSPVIEDAIGMLRDAFGTARLVWGSDWPHTQFESATSFKTALAALHHWLPDASARHSVLVDTPASLFGFEGPVDRATHPDGVMVPKTLSTRRSASC